MLELSTLPHPFENKFKGSTQVCLQYLSKTWYFSVVPRALENLNHLEKKLFVFSPPSEITREDDLSQFVNLRDQSLKIECKAIFWDRQKISFVRHYSSFEQNQLFCIGIIPFVKPWHDPALVGSAEMNWNPKEHPEKGFEVVHKRMVLTPEHPDRHESCCTSFALSTEKG